MVNSRLVKQTRRLKKATALKSNNTKQPSSTSTPLPRVVLFSKHIMCCAYTTTSKFEHNAVATRTRVAMRSRCYVTSHFCLEHIPRPSAFSPRIPFQLPFYLLSVCDSLYPSLESLIVSESFGHRLQHVFKDCSFVPKNPPNLLTIQTHYVCDLRVPF